MSDEKAGRALDERVAREVMGWVPGVPTYVHGPLMHGGSMMVLYRGPGLPLPGGFTPSVESWKPSEDITQAWVVVEKMEADGFRWQVGHDEIYFDRGDDSTPEYQFGNYWNDYPDSSTPLGICLAALKAVVTPGSTPSAHPDGEKT